MRMISPLKILRVLLARISFSRRHQCIICGHRVGVFLAYGDGWRNGWRVASPLMRELNMVGSDLDHYQCPWCGSHDRERHLLLYMRVTGILNKLQNSAVLHFAPERHLAPIIAECNPSHYVKCDLFPQAPNIEKVNIMAMHYDAGSFDFVIANHVLEHVGNDLDAIAEIIRVLKPGGYAILQTPYSSKINHTWSDSGIDDDAARLQAFGQEDHVRLFGRDIFERIASVGLESCVATHDCVLSEYDSVKYGVNVHEPFFLFKRP